MTAAEAKLAWERISEWAKRPSSTYKMMQQREGIKDFDEWLKVHDAKERKNPLGVLPITSSSQNKYSVDEFSHLYKHEEDTRERTEWEKKAEFAKAKNDSLTIKFDFYLKCVPFPSPAYGRNGVLIAILADSNNLVYL